MTVYIFIASLLLLFALGVALNSLIEQRKPSDSMLKQRAIFNMNEHLTFTRLQEILPQCIILVHVSYDALLTTKFNRTRHKYRDLVADFVVLDEYHHVLAIVAVDDAHRPRHSKRSEYEDALLNMAGYQVFRYDDVPEYAQLRQDLLSEQFNPYRSFGNQSVMGQQVERRKKQRALS